VQTPLLLGQAVAVGETAINDASRSEEFAGRIRIGRRIHQDALRVVFDALMEELHDTGAHQLRCCGFWQDVPESRSQEGSLRTLIQNGVQLSRPFFQRAGQVEKWEKLVNMSNDDLAGRQLPEREINSQRDEFAKDVKERFRFKRCERDFPILYVKGKFLRFLPMSFVKLVDRVSWRIALINLSDYWARGVEATDFPISGFAKKYHTHLLSLAEQPAPAQSSL